MRPIHFSTEPIFRSWWQSLPQRALIGVVRAYRLLVSPSLGSACRFEPSCSAYSLLALRRHGAGIGSYLTLRRLVRCQPWCDGGHDPVPPSSRYSLFTRLVDSSTEASFEKPRS